MYWVKMTLAFHLEDQEDLGQISEFFHKEIRKIDEGGGVVGEDIKKMGELPAGRLDHSKFHKPNYSRRSK